MILVDGRGRMKSKRTGFWRRAPVVTLVALYACSGVSSNDPDGGGTERDSDTPGADASRDADDGDGDRDLDFDSSEDGDLDDAAAADGDIDSVEDGDADSEVVDGEAEDAGPSFVCGEHTCLEEHEFCVQFSSGILGCPSIAFCEPIMGRCGEGENDVCECLGDHFSMEFPCTEEPFRAPAGCGCMEAPAEGMFTVVCVAP